MFRQKTQPLPVMPRSSHRKLLRTMRYFTMDLQGLIQQLSWRKKLPSPGVTNQLANQRSKSSKSTKTRITFPIARGAQNVSEHERPSTN